MSQSIDKHPPRAVPGFIWLPSHPIEGAYVLVSVETIVYVAADEDLGASTVCLLDDTEILTSLPIVDVADRIREAIRE